MSSSTNLAIVDDRDPLIQYTGSWANAGSAEEFKSTTRCSTIAGSTAALTFTGTSLDVYGTIPANVDPSTGALSFVIDNSIQGSFQPTTAASDLHHQSLWTSPALSSGSHTLVITTQTTTAGKCGVYLDYITFTTTSKDVPAYFIDDRDSRIAYQPAWVQEGSEQDFMGTSQKSPGAGSKLTLEFEGRGISFFGGINNNASRASATLDGGAPQTFTASSNILFLNTPFYTSPSDLAAGNHTLVFTSETDAVVWADYFLVLPSLDSSPTSSGPTTSIQTPSSSATSSIPFSSPSHRNNTGIVVGSVIGAILILTCIAALLWFCIRNRRRATADSIPYTSQLTGIPTIAAAAPFAITGSISPFAYDRRNTAITTSSTALSSNTFRSDSNDSEKGSMPSSPQEAGPSPSMISGRTSNFNGAVESSTNAQARRLSALSEAPPPTYIE
ncbi:hypothetical protein C8F01DRAFT_1029869 [Mycena amicta]|nr:hypothetical protein C8F01DRAFT_1029869 [Mycena amicta]